MQRNGHGARECPSNGKAIQNFNTVGLSDQDPFAVKAFFAADCPGNSVEKLHCSDEVGASADWYMGEDNCTIDIGASSRMPPSASNMTNYIELRRSIIIGNESTLPIEAHGNLPTVFQSSECREYTTLCNVAHVLSLH